MIEERKEEKRREKRPENEEKKVGIDVWKENGELVKEEERGEKKR